MDIEKRVFAASSDNFDALAIELFQYQYYNSVVYRQYCDSLKVNTDAIDTIQQIPFLPISFFKTHTIKTTEFEPETIFESSGDINSLLQLPFPLYTDIILRQVKEKQKEKRLQEDRMKTLQRTKNKQKAPNLKRR